jgi:hypothetical protein
MDGGNNLRYWNHFVAMCLILVCVVLVSGCMSPKDSGLSNGAGTNPTTIEGSYGVQQSSLTGHSPANTDVGKAKTKSLFVDVACHYYQTPNKDGSYTDVSIEGTVPNTFLPFDYDKIRQPGYEGYLSGTQTSWGEEATLNYHVVYFLPGIEDTCHKPPCGPCKWTYDGPIHLVGVDIGVPYPREYDPLKNWQLSFLLHQGKGGVCDGHADVINEGLLKQEYGDCYLNAPEHQGFREGIEQFSIP